MLSVQTLMQEVHMDPRSRPRAASARKEERRRFEAALERLPEMPRLVLSLRAFETLRARQIASVLEISEAEVQEMLADAVRRIVAFLDGGDPGSGARTGVPGKSPARSAVPLQASAVRAAGRTVAPLSARRAR